MALVTTAGTETLHTAHFEAVTNVEKNLILGEAHHIYTVLSIIVYADSIGDATGVHGLKLFIDGYDSTAGSSQEYIHIARAILPSAVDTYVFNDKFSLNGDEPSSNTQAARAEQASGTAQRLVALATSGSNFYHVTITFIDQNNN